MGLLDLRVATPPLTLILAPALDQAPARAGTLNPTARGCSPPLRCMSRLPSRPPRPLLTSTLRTPPPPLRLRQRRVATAAPADLATLERRKALMALTALTPQPLLPPRNPAQTATPPLPAYRPTRTPAQLLRPMAGTKATNPALRLTRRMTAPTRPSPLLLPPSRNRVRTETLMVPRLPPRLPLSSLASMAMGPSRPALPSLLRLHPLR